MTTKTKESTDRKAGSISQGMLESKAIVEGPDGRGLVIYRVTSPTGMPDEMIEADVRRFAASPDLIAACEALLAAPFCDEGAKWEFLPKKCQDAIVLAKSALAKARGTP